MRVHIFVMALALMMISCTNPQLNTPLKESQAREAALAKELSDARAEITNLQAKLRRLSETPEGAWTEIAAARAEKQWSTVALRAKALIQRWPDSNVSKQARVALSEAERELAHQLYLQAQDEMTRGNPVAEGTLNTIISNYPNSEYAPRARADLKGLKARLAAAAEKRDKQLQAEQLARQKANSHLELRAFSWHHESGYAIAEGQVRNVTGSAIDNVQAVVSFKDAGGNFITSDSALVEYQPLLPGQSSPFTVMARWNPEMKSASIEFKQLMGGTLTSFDGRPKR